MNIEFQICGLILSVLLLILYVSKRTFKIYSEIIFLRTLIVNIILLIADISSIVVIRYRNVLPETFVYFVCKLYVAFLILQTCMALIYILYDVVEEKTHKKVTGCLLGATGLESVLVFFTPIYIYENGRNVYTYGPCTIVVYGFVCLYLFAMLFFAFLKKKKIYRRRWFAFMLWMGIWLLAAAIQFVDSTKLVVGFASALGMVILYILLENPESNLNRELGCFNSYALNNYSKQLFQHNTPFYVIFSSFEKAKGETEYLVHQLLAYVKQCRGSFVFKELNMDFFLITENREEYEKILKWIRKEKEKEDSKLQDIVVLFMQNGLMAKKASNIQKLFPHYFTKFMKIGGGQMTELTEEMVDEFLLQEEMVGEIRNALDEDRVEVFLQPIYATRSHSFVSAEALVRIRREDNSLIPPGVMIPVAERTGLIIELGERVFEKTCQFLAEENVKQWGIEYIEINLSIVQCEQEHLAESLERIMDKYQVSPSAINLEITETGTLNAKKKLLANMEKLLERGCHFALDDFGKGESNLMYVVEMPVSIVKLDFDMTKAFFREEKARSVLLFVVAMAHDMGLSVVAEGVETEEELAAMTAQGIDYIQGYYFSKPLPMEQFVALMTDNRKMAQK